GWEAHADRIRREDHHPVPEPALLEHALPNVDGRARPADPAQQRGRLLALHHEAPERPRAAARGGPGPRGHLAEPERAVDPLWMSTRARFLDMGTNLPRWEDDREFRGGLDGKLVFHDAYTLDAALNP